MAIRAVSLFVCADIRAVISRVCSFAQLSGRVKDETLILKGWRAEQSREDKPRCNQGPPSAGTCRR